MVWSCLFCFAAMVRVLRMCFSWLCGVQKVVQGRVRQYTKDGKV